LDKELTPEDIVSLNPLGRKSLKDALEFIKNPRKMCDEIYGYVSMLYQTILRHKLGQESVPSRCCVCAHGVRVQLDVPADLASLYQNETWELAERRWGKLLHDFRRPQHTVCVRRMCTHGLQEAAAPYYYDISKIPDIYDNVKYDMEHNPELCLNHEQQFERMYLCVKNVADVLVPSEYGIKKDGKLTIAQGICTPLMKKIQSDLRRCIDDETADENVTRLDPRSVAAHVRAHTPRACSATEGIATPNRHVRTRLYFTSESHIHTLMNLVQHGGIGVSSTDRKWQRAMNYLSSVTEFNYMTQLVLMLYEDTSEEARHDPAGKRFRLELLFSPGLYPCFQTEKERIYETGYGCARTCPASGKIMSLSPSLGGTPRRKDSAGVCVCFCVSVCV
jgi:inositol hexakisphosphate/diphosphoinositol-pentakisphosphate kinase